MTPSKYTLDEQLRRYALGNLRATLTRLKDGDKSTAPATTAEASWRELYLNKAAKWAQIAEALRPEAGRPVEYEFRLRGPEIDRGEPGAIPPRGDRS